MEPTGNLAQVRALFHRTLQAADDEAFLCLIFAIDALQKGREKLAAPLLRNKYPAEAIGAKLPSTNRVHEWELETLANEKLAQPYRRFGFGFHEPYIDCNDYGTIATLTNLLRKIEDLEYAASGFDIYKELARIAGRQFEWQRGFYNQTLLYRSAYLFIGSECERQLKAKTGFAFQDLSYAAFCLFAVFNNFARMDRNLPLDHVGISNRLREAVLDLISKPIDEVRQLAREQRESWNWTAYRPSILRQSPCIYLRYSGNFLIAPLPDLILERLTSGIF